MGNILRRVTAFLLGIVFTITALVGGVVGGAYYAYKNISPIEDIIAPNDKDTEDALGDLYGASIEELVDLIFNAMDSDKNGEYTFDTAHAQSQNGTDVKAEVGVRLNLAF